MKLTFFNKGAVCLMFAMVCVAVSTNASAEKRLSIVTGPTSGVYFPLGGALSKILTTSLPDTTATSGSTSGSIDNIRMLGAGKADIAFAQADQVWDGYKGYGKFEQPQPIRALAVIYANTLHFVALRGSGISTVADLRGKRVSTGPKDSGAEAWSNRLMQASGLNPDKDIVRTSLAPAESAALLKERKIDAFFWAGGIPTKAIADLAKEPGVRTQILNTAVGVPAMLRQFGPVYTDGEIPIYRKGQIRVDSYAGVTKPVPVAQVWNLVVVRADMDEKLVYNIVKTLFEHKSDLVAAHPEAANLDLVNQRGGGSPIPFHPGAKKYYSERGVNNLR